MIIDDLKKIMIALNSYVDKYEKITEYQISKEAVCMDFKGFYISIRDLIEEYE